MHNIDKIVDEYANEINLVRKGQSLITNTFRILEMDWPIAIEYLENVIYYTSLELKTRNGTPIFREILGSSLSTYSKIMSIETNDIKRLQVFIEETCAIAITEVAKFTAVSKSGNQWTPAEGPLTDWLVKNGDEEVTIKKTPTKNLEQISTAFCQYTITQHMRNIMERNYAS